MPNFQSNKLKHCISENTDPNKLFRTPSGKKKTRNFLNNIPKDLSNLKMKSNKNIDKEIYGCLSPKKSKNVFLLDTLYMSTVYIQGPQPDPRKVLCLST